MPTVDASQKPQALIPVQDAEADLHVASLAVHCRPESLADARDWLLSQAGVEIHAQNEQGKLVVVIESYRAQDILDLIDRAHDRAGIVNAALIYHEIVAANELEEPEKPEDIAPQEETAHQERRAPQEKKAPPEEEEAQ